MSAKDCAPADCSERPPEVDPEAAVILKGQLGDLQRAGERLEGHGIESAIVRGESTDAAGCCSTTLYLVVARDHVAEAMAVFDADWKRGLSPHQIAALEASAGIVLDPDAPETTCPACLTTFATGPAECPDCGLSIA
jgi:hypothetical protein